MRYRLLVSAIVSALLLSQPVTLAAAIPKELHSSSIELTNLLASSNMGTEIEQDSSIFEWQKQFQKIQQATFQVLEPVLANESVDDVKSNFQSKLADLATTVNLSKIQSGLASNVVEGIDNAQEWSRDLAADTQEKVEGFQLPDLGKLIGDVDKPALGFQEWAGDLSSSLTGNLRDLQDWGTDIVANLGDNLFFLSAELEEIQQDAEGNSSSTPQELTEIQKVERMTANLSAELNQIQHDLDEGSTEQELAKIQKAEQIVAALSAELSQIQQDVESEAKSEVTEQELAEIQKAEQITDLVSGELNQMEKAAETTAALSEELNELQEVVEAYDEEVEPTNEEVASVETEPEIIQVAEELATVETEPKKEVAQTVESEATTIIEEVASVETEPEITQVAEELAVVETEPENENAIATETVPTEVSTNKDIEELDTLASL